MEDKTSLGKFISMRRRFLRLTQEELAAKIGVSKSAIAKWETNGGLPDRDNLRRLGDAIHVPVDEMYRLIKGSAGMEADRNINITSDVIAALESHGYKVIRPGQKAEGDLK